LHPIDKEMSDMLPAISLCIDRLFEGKEIYAPQPEVFGLRPLYLPAFWLPYIPFKLAHLDMRWANIICMFLTSSMLGYWIIKISKNNSLHLLLSAILLCVSIDFIYKDIDYFLLTEEACVILYFSILIIGIYKINYKWIASGLILTLLSRYMHLFWVPILFISLFIHDKQKTIKSAIFTLIGIAILFGYFLIKYFYYFIQIPSIHNNVQLRHLEENNFVQLSHNSPNLGFSKYYSPACIHLQPKVQIIGCVVIMIIGILYILTHLSKFKSEDFFKLYTISLLKIMLVFFLSFLIMPYRYLFYTSIFTSIIIFMFSNSKNQVAK
jgi:hypothetical protein